MWIEAVRSGEPGRTQAVKNTVFGELFTLQGDAPEVSAVGALRGAYRSDEVPEGAVVLTAGVDVQKDRLFYAVRAWGDRATSWLIRHGELFGDTDRAEVWTDLGALLAMDWSGRRIRLMLVDSGFRPDPVYTFARRYPGRVFPSKGHDGRDKPVSIVKLDVTAQGKQSRRGISLAHVDASHFKSFVHGRITWPVDQPGAWHLPADATDDYCEQITAESRVVKSSGNVIWIRSKKANHYLDCEALNAAAGHVLNVHSIVRARPKPEAEPAPATAPRPKGEPRAAPRLRPVRGHFVARRPW
jgi:phage terminase large subunit GpA-like protein